MQIKRLLDDREVFVGDKVFDAQGRPYALVRHSYVSGMSGQALQPLFVSHL